MNTSMQRLALASIACILLVACSDITEPVKAAKAPRVRTAGSHVETTKLSRVDTASTDSDSTRTVPGGGARPSSGYPVWW